MEELRACLPADPGARLHLDLAAAVAADCYLRCQILALSLAWLLAGSPLPVYALPLVTCRALSLCQGLCLCHALCLCQLLSVQDLQ